MSSAGHAIRPRDPLDPGGMGQTTISPPLSARQSFSLTSWDSKGVGSRGAQGWTEGED